MAEVHNEYYRKLREKKRLMQRVDEKELQALELRKRGLSYQAIADTMGYKDKSAVYSMVKKCLERVQLDINSSATELKAMELARLDDLLVKLNNKLDLDSLSATDLTQLCNTIIKVQDQRSKLEGLYAPTKLEQDVSVKNHEQALEELA